VPPIETILFPRPAATLLWVASGLALTGCIAAALRWRRRAAQRRKDEIERLVRERTLALQRSNSEKAELLGNLAHEFRDPLNGAIGLAFALDQTELDPGQRHQLGMLRQCADHLSSLVGDIAQFSRMEAGAIRTEPFGVHEMLESVRAVSHEESIALGIPLDISIDRSVPKILLGDRHRIQQVLLRYAGFALQHAGRGRITLSARAVPVPSSKFQVTFTVSDEGPGLSSSEQARIFTVGGLGGAGPGLALCRVLAEGMGGMTTVDGEVGDGCRFDLKLVLEPSAAEPAANPFRTPFSPRTPALVVEARESNSAGLVAMLLRLGINADVANRADEALRRIAAADYVLAFVDCSLPEMSGPELARAIRRMESPGAHLPLIATATDATEKFAAECRAAGMDGFLAKPITPSRLRAAVFDCLHSLGIELCPYYAVPDAGAAAPYRLDSLEYLSNGVPSEFNRRLEAYVRELDGYVDEIAAAASSGDLEIVRQTAHKIVGHMAIIQHARLILIAQQVEEAAVNRSLADANSKLVELIDGAREVSGALLSAAARPD